MNLLAIRELMRSEKGEMLLRYLMDYMVEVASRGNSNAEWIKGMGMLISRLQKVDEECRQLNEINRR